jgi:hypothetical protein
MPQISQNIYILTHPLPERTSIKNPTHMTCMDNVVKVVFGWLTPCCLPESKTQLSTGRSISVLYIAEILQGAPRIAICGGGAMACLDLARVAVTAPQLTAYLQTSVFSSLLAPVATTATGPRPLLARLAHTPRGRWTSTPTWSRPPPPPAPRRPPPTSTPR